MFWMYLVIFVFAVLTPEIIQSGHFFLGEEDLESLLIFCFGTFGVIVYFIKEKALIRLIKERLRLQKQANVISRDLSDSYSYIGEMNRRLDIVKELIFRLPEDTNAAIKKGAGWQDGIYYPIIETVKLLSRAESVSVCFVGLKSKRIEKRIDDGPRDGLACLNEKHLVRSKKIFCEEDGCIIVRSPKHACGVTAFIVFPKTSNGIDDIETFKMVASEALFLYCIEQGIIKERSGR